MINLGGLEGSLILLGIFSVLGIALLLVTTIRLKAKTNRWWIPLLVVLVLLLCGALARFYFNTPSVLVVVIISIPVIFIYYLLYPVSEIIITKVKFLKNKTIKIVTTLLLNVLVTYLALVIFLVSLHLLIRLWQI